MSDFELYIDLAKTAMQGHQISLFSLIWNDLRWHPNVTDEYRKCKINSSKFQCMYVNKK